MLLPFFDVNAVNDYGETALHSASRSNDHLTCTLVIQRGANRLFSKSRLLPEDLTIDILLHGRLVGTPISLGEDTESMMLQREVMLEKLGQSHVTPSVTILCSEAEIVVEKPSSQIDRFELLITHLFQTSSELKYCCSTNNSTCYQCAHMSHAD